MHVSCLTYERVTSKGWRVESRTWPAHAARHLRRPPPAPHEPLPGLYVHPLHPGAQLLAQRCFLGRGEWKDVCIPCLKMSLRTRRLQAQSPRVRSLEDIRLVEDGDMAGRRNQVSTVFSAGSARAGLNALIPIHAQTHAHTYTHIHIDTHAHTHTQELYSNTHICTAPYTCTHTKHTMHTNKQKHQTFVHIHACIHTMQTYNTCMRASSNVKGVVGEGVVLEESRFTISLFLPLVRCLFVSHSLAQACPLFVCVRFRVCVSDFLSVSLSVSSCLFVSACGYTFFLSLLLLLSM